ncbi:GGDEF domain-containing protein [Marinibactrum halimedae]|uniref:diguanylate cyclase n=1 Tax=Marinibactrum halimedae TaxID=1444977 RepID=A0AA37T6S1_9GAMM|nr:GGDEF domain-containing protein [Marinibactrum halimedae]MCD9460921.1 diguanylate cyclase [Marinibactrum halimedae]GLS24595.1 hypothetical protein GCM10007877_03090 [Marinibactrum halimedae]
MSTGWREKYLQALSDQERIEKISAAQIEQFRKGIIKLSEASLGVDEQLDEELERVIAYLRRQTRTRTALQTDELQKRADAAIARRESNDAASLKALSSLTESLKDLNPSGELVSALKQFEKTVKKDPVKLYQYPKMLEELSELQSQTLEAIIETKPGWWGKITGTKATLKESSSELTSSEQIDSPELNDLIDEENQGEEPTSPDDTSPNDDTAEPVNDRTIASQESDAGPAFSRIASRISRVLADILDSIHIEPCVEDKANTTRDRIANGLNWYELVPTLEDVRDLVLQAYLEANRSFTEYLNQVNDALLFLNEHLSIATTENRSQVTLSGRVHDALKSEQGRLELALQAASDLQELKGSVKEHIEALYSNLSELEQLKTSGQTLDTELIAVQERLSRLEQEHQEALEELETERKKALTDTLTELPNREAFNQRLHHEFQRWQRYGHPLSLAICDVDHFKKFNDTYGHQTGDKVLKIIANLLVKRLREVDFIARFGGEEFVILLPETHAREGYNVLESVREALSQAAFRFKDQPVTITASFGITDFQEEDTTTTVFARADNALYQAKDQGRNCVVYAEKEEKKPD